MTNPEISNLMKDMREAVKFRLAVPRANILKLLDYFEREAAASPEPAKKVCETCGESDNGCSQFGCWIACGIHNWGFALGDFSHRFPDQINTGMASFMAMMGPFGVPAVLFSSGDRHWLLKPLTTEQRWEAFHKLWPELSRDDFEQSDD